MDSCHQNLLACQSQSVHLVMSSYKWTMVNFVSALYAFAGVNNSASIVIHFAIGGRGLVNPAILIPVECFLKLEG